MSRMSVLVCGVACLLLWCVRTKRCEIWVTLRSDGTVALCSKTAGNAYAASGLSMGSRQSQ